KHSPVSISSIVTRPKTGEIVALATLPNFDPGNIREGEEDQRRNRAISDVAEPGSTFKIVVIAGALNEQAVTLEDIFDCEQGHFLYAGKLLHDAHGGYGLLSVKNIITRSSNIGAAKVGLKLGPSSLYTYVRAFGFGERTGIPLVGEVRGLVHPVDKWSKLSI